jgi:hypothetical protein
VGGGEAFPRVNGEVNVIFGGHGSQENKRQQKLNDRQILVAATSAPAPYRWSKHPITFTWVDQWLNFDHLGKYPLLVDPVIRESRCWDHASSPKVLQKERASAEAART